MGRTPLVTNTEEKRLRRNAYMREWNALNKEKKKTANKKYYTTNKEDCLERCKVYRDSPEGYLVHQEYLQKTRDRRTISRRKYRQKNKWLFAAHEAARRSRRKEATPFGLSEDDLERINFIYKEASDSSLTVDHIVPLNGKTVCGLHVPWNMQLLTYHENNAKSNRF